MNKAEERHREKQAVLSNDGNEGSGGRSRDAVVKPKDPLDFWVVQVCSLLRFIFKNVDFFYLIGKKQRIRLWFSRLGSRYISSASHKRTERKNIQYQWFVK